MKYRYKGRGKIEANGYTWDGHGAVVDVGDPVTLQKLKTHPSFERVDG
jgi:hypothetical protein